MLALLLACADEPETTPADTGAACTPAVWHTDADGDGFGDPASQLLDCAQPDGAVLDATDCDDENAGVHPGAEELCDYVDNDCDGTIEDEPPETRSYYDGDGDGYGDPDNYVEACDTIYVDNALDCDDTDPAVHTGAEELYGDDVDQDCDGATYPTFACDGVAVPGDYATIQEAVDALVGTGATICLAPGEYDEDVTLGYDLAVVGPSPRETTIAGAVTMLATGADLSTMDVATLRGVRLAAGLTLEPGNGFGGEVHVEDVVVESPDGWAVYVTRPGLGWIDATFARIDASSGGDGAFGVNDDGTEPGELLDVAIEDSWIHDSAVGVGARANGSIVYPDSRVALANVTITDCGTGLSFWGNRATTTWNWRNTVVTGADVGVDLAEAWSTGVHVGHDVYWGNTTDFAGSAAADATDLFVDPRLDTAFVPPRPGAGSPLVDAADTAYATLTDFWGVQRDDAPDIGAVED